MTMTAEKIQGFTPAQYEIINMMSCLQGESDYAELKSLLVKFLDSRLQVALDGLYASGDLSDEKLQSLSKRHLRTYRHLLRV